MRIDIITLFPEFFEGIKDHSIVGRAIGSGRVELVTHNLRDWASDKYKSVDDHPYGGGVGMVLKVDVMHRALVDVRGQIPDFSGKVILLTPQGQVYKQTVAQSLAQEQNLILICGHYEGFDERIREYVDMEISIGDYVLTGGELAAMVIVDSVARLLPGVLGDDKSSIDESHSPSTSSGQALLEYPQYTRPDEYDEKKVPEILLGGNHKEIDAWRKVQSQERTKARRPDLLNVE
jgi:tRNA (guanine37-N1)-methyltransferase